MVAVIAATASEARQAGLAVRYYKIPVPRDYAVDHTCQNCSKVFQAVPQDGPNRRYCTEVCQQSARRRRQREAARKRVRCAMCGKHAPCRFDRYGIVEHDSGYVDKKLRKFCSANCAARWWISQDQPVTPDDTCEAILSLIRQFSH